MQTSISLSTLNDIMDIMLRFVSKHATLPILENIYIKAKDNSLLLRATDMEKYVEVTIPAVISDEASITINAKTFSDILRTIDDTMVNLEIHSAKDELVIGTSQDSFQLKGIAASEYVATPQIQAKTAGNVALKYMSDGIAKVEYAVTEKNFSPIMTGILMRTKEYVGQKKLVFVGTDSFRLAEYKIDLGQESFEHDISIVIPKIHVLDIKKVLDYMMHLGIEQAQLQISDAMLEVSATINDMTIRTMTLLIQGNFPEYENENIMPTSWNHSILVDANQCEKAIKKIATITRSLNNYIALNAHDNQLEMGSGVTDLGEGKTSIPTQLQGDSVRFGLNGKYVSDFIKNISGSELVMHIVTGEKPIIFKDPSQDHYSYIIRPLVK